MLVVGVSISKCAYGGVLGAAIWTGGKRAYFAYLTHLISRNDFLDALMRQELHDRFVVLKSFLIMF